MGGRGSFSYNGRKVAYGGSAGGGGQPALAAPEQRREIRARAQSLGFRDAYSTDKIDSDVMSASLDRISELERKYGAIGDSENVVLNGVNTSAFAYVSRDGETGLDPKRQSLNFSLTTMQNSKQIINDVKEGVKRKHFMPAKMDNDTLLKYVVTHEYGHMVQNVLYTKSGSEKKLSTWANDVKRDIIRRASKISDSKNISQYGRKNAREFFAESFANAHSGKPNALGKAMLEYLKDNGLG